MNETERQIVAWLCTIDEMHPLALRLAANCEMPDVDLSWVMPFIANAIADGDHKPQQESDDGR